MAPDLKGITASTQVNDIHALELCKAIDLHKSGEWKLPNSRVIDQSDSGEEFDMPNDSEIGDDNGNESWEDDN